MFWQNCSLCFPPWIHFIESADAEIFNIIQGRSNKMLQRKKNYCPPIECHNNPLTQVNKWIKNLYISPSKTCLILTISFMFELGFCRILGLYFDCQKLTVTPCFLPCFVSINYKLGTNTKVLFDQKIDILFLRVLCDNIWLFDLIESQTWWTNSC